MKKIINDSSKNENLGKFKIRMKTINNNKEEFDFDKISQEELADGWIQVLPRRSTYHPMYHFNISLAELPPYLWKYLNYHLLFNNDNDFVNIKDKIYIYSIQKSEHDLHIYNLYIQLMNRYKNNNIILELYNYCKENKINGWIMIKTKQYLH